MAGGTKSLALSRLRQNLLATTILGIVVILRWASLGMRGGEVGATLAASRDPWPAILIAALERNGDILRTLYGMSPSLCVQGMVGPFAAHQSSGLGPHFVVHARHQPAERRAVARSGLPQQPGRFAG